MNVFLLFILMIIAVFRSGFAQHVIDMYGYEGPNKKTVIEKYAKDIEVIADILEQRLRYSGDSKKQQSFIDSEKARLSAHIKHDLNALFVDFNTVFYPGYSNIYTTIEVIDSAHPERLRFIQTSTRLSPSLPRPQDVIEAMRQYVIRGTQLMFAHRLPSPKQACPVYHCLFGFETPEFRPYLNQFNAAALHQKTLIESTLKQDSNPKRRAAAALLVGHYSDAAAILALLTPYIKDNDKEVRNNSMRVVGATLTKSPATSIDIEPLISLLTSPYETDRNKALFILSQIIVSDPRAKHALLLQGEDVLLSLLALHQPNNHDLAYLLLKFLSGKDYGEYNIASWKSWWDQAKRDNVR